MTQEEKELLLQDLCARLSYGVKLQCGGVLIGKTHQRYIKERCDAILYSITEVYDNCYVINARYDLIEVKPYLRPMSSMTEDEREELEHLSEEYFGKALDKQIQESFSSNRNESRILEYIASSVIIDWLNKNHFDYRGLIEKGLALEAPEGIYN